MNKNLLHRFKSGLFNSSYSQKNVFILGFFGSKVGFFKLSDRQREKFIEADLSDDRHIYDLLVSQKNFIEGSIKTLDNMGFAIKNRLDISKL